VVEVNPKKGAGARQFAAKVNSVSKRTQPAG
jgi:hypothetical protein